MEAGDVATWASGAVAVASVVVAVIGNNRATAANTRADAAVAAAERANELAREANEISRGAAEQGSTTSWLLEAVPPVEAANARPFDWMNGPHEYLLQCLGNRAVTNLKVVFGFDAGGLIGGRVERNRLDVSSPAIEIVLHAKRDRIIEAMNNVPEGREATVTWSDLLGERHEQKLAIPYPEYPARVHE